MKSETQRPAQSVSDTPGLPFDLQDVYQSRDTLIRDASNKGLRKQFLIFDPSVDFQLSASRQKTPRCNQPQDQVSPHTANTPSLSQPPEFCQCRYGTYDLTAEKPAYDAKELNHFFCQRATRLVKNHKPTNYPHWQISTAPRPAQACSEQTPRY